MKAQPLDEHRRGLILSECDARGIDREKAEAFLEALWRPPGEIWFNLQEHSRKCPKLKEVEPALAGLENALAKVEAAQAISWLSHGLAESGISLIEKSNGLPITANRLCYLLKNAAVWGQEEARSRERQGGRPKNPYKLYIVRYYMELWERETGEEPTATEAAGFTYIMQILWIWLCEYWGVETPIIKDFRSDIIAIKKESKKG